MKAALILLAVIALNATTGRAADAPPAAEAAFRKIVAAMTSDNYEMFIADGDAAFRGLKREAFESVVSQLAPRFKAGFDTTYLGELRQQGFDVSLWRFRFKDGRDDMLGTLSLKDGKVGGFWIK
jgi:hypothetical protein